MASSGSVVAFTGVAHQAVPEVGMHAAAVSSSDVEIASTEADSSHVEEVKHESKVQGHIQPKRLQMEVMPFGEEAPVSLLECVGHFLVLITTCQAFYLSCNNFRNRILLCAELGVIRAALPTE
jgi:hypothetical protein